MTWPTTNISTTNLDAGTDNPATARADIKSMADSVNEMTNAISLTGISNNDVLRYNSSVGKLVPAAVSALTTNQNGPQAIFLPVSTYYAVPQRKGESNYVNDSGASGIFACAGYGFTQVHNPSGFVSYSNAVFTLEPGTYTYHWTDSYMARMYANTNYNQFSTGAYFTTLGVGQAGYYDRWEPTYVENRTLLVPNGSYGYNGQNYNKGTLVADSSRKYLWFQSGYVDSGGTLNSIDNWNSSLGRTGMYSNYLIFTKIA